MTTPNSGSDANGRRNGVTPPSSGIEPAVSIDDVCEASMIQGMIAARMARTQVGVAGLLRIAGLVLGDYRALQGINLNYIDFIAHFKAMIDEGLVLRERNGMNVTYSLDPNFEAQFMKVGGTD